jgi:hypothetical protein
MSTSLRERILQAVASRVQGAATVSGARFVRQPVLGIPTEQAPVLVMMFDGEQVLDRSALHATREISLRVGALTRNTNDTADLTAADALLVSAHAALLADTTLGGLALAVDEQGAELETADTADVAVLLAQRYAVRYRTRTAALDVA